VLFLFINSFMKSKILVIACFCALVTACSVKKPNRPVSGPIPNEVGFTSENKAAIAAINSAVKQSVTVEEAGGIYVENSLYYYTSPQTNKLETSFNIKLEYPPTAKIVALYHTHPNHPLNYLVSPEDIKVADNLKVDSFIGVIRNSSEIICYTPGKDPTFPFLGLTAVSDGHFVSDLKLP
jgi:hypothetical protein